MDADALYLLPPEEFTAARDAAAKQAKADGDKEAAAALKALRRPTVSAWLVNALAHEQAALLDQLLDLGPALAEAQSGGDAAALRTLGAQRRQLVEAVVGTAVGLAGRSVTSAVREEVAATLEAALSDAASAEAVRSGRLVRALSYAGFGTVDLSDAVAPAPRPQSKKGGKKKVDDRAAKVASAESAALDASGRLDDAVRACEQAERQRAAAEAAVQQAAQEVERAEALLAEAREAKDAADREAHAARSVSEMAVAKVGRAQDAAETAREELDRLRRS